MRRLLFVVFAVALLPFSADAQSLANVPSVIVFPFTSNGSSVDREASSRLATIIATEMATSKHVRVLPPPPGTERKDFLTTARSAGADYYVSGFISPLGDGVSVVEQVVGTTSGIVLYSNSAQLTNYADAAGQGDVLAEFCTQDANRAYAALPTPPPAATPAPTQSNGIATNIGKLFGRRKTTRGGSAAARPAATPASAPTAAAALKNVTAAAGAAAATATTPTALGVLVAGDVSRTLRDQAAARLVKAFGASAPAKRIDAPLPQVRSAGGAVCRADGVARIAVATLSVRTPSAFGSRRARLDLTVYDCGGAVVWQRGFDGAARSASAAIAAAVDAGAAAYRKG